MQLSTERQELSSREMLMINDRNAMKIETQRAENALKELEKIDAVLAVAIDQDMIKVEESITETDPRSRIDRLLKLHHTVSVLKEEKDLFEQHLSKSLKMQESSGHEVDLLNDPSQKLLYKEAIEKNYALESKLKEIRRELNDCRKVLNWKVEKINILFKVLSKNQKNLPAMQEEVKRFSILLKEAITVNQLIEKKSAALSNVNNSVELDIEFNCLDENVLKGLQKQAFLNINNLVEKERFYMHHDLAVKKLKSAEDILPDVASCTETEESVQVRNGLDLLETRKEIHDMVYLKRLVDVREGEDDLRNWTTIQEQLNIVNITTAILQNEFEKLIIGDKIVLSTSSICSMMQTLLQHQNIRAFNMTPKENFGIWNHVIVSRVMECKRNEDIVSQTKGPLENQNNGVTFGLKPEREISNKRDLCLKIKEKGGKELEKQRLTNAIQGKYSEFEECQIGDGSGWKFHPFNCPQPIQQVHNESIMESNLEDGTVGGDTDVLKQPKMRGSADINECQNMIKCSEQMLDNSNRNADKKHVISQEIPFTNQSENAGDENLEKTDNEIFDEDFVTLRSLAEDLEVRKKEAEDALKMIESMKANTFLTDQKKGSGETEERKKIR